jgi:diphthamide synthase (EF-2-diphthine--ammonia ligase)
LFLEDVRAYREAQLLPTGLKPMFPLWQLPTAGLAREMISAGLRAKLTCVDTKQLPYAFVGRDYDSMLLEELPPDTDPCGERGEFHTCVYAGPMFQTAIPLDAGEVVMRDQFAFADFTIKSA